MTKVMIDLKPGQVTEPQRFAENLAKTLDDLGLEFTALEVKHSDLTVTIYRPTVVRIPWKEA